MKKTACLLGITGQDGSYLAELLLDKGYEVHGVIRRSSSFNTERINHIFNKLKLHYGDVSDPISINNIVESIKPDELYNLAAQSHVQVSFEVPYYTGQVDALGTLNLLEAIRKYSPKTKIYNAVTSELYGRVQEVPQTEKTAFYPRSPYGVAKLYSYWIAKNYREAYNLFITNGILFNHESERRGMTFVTRKITMGFAKIFYELNARVTPTPIVLGNLYAKRDWGYAQDFVEGMYLMLQQDKPDDYLLATNETHSVKEFIQEVADYLNINLHWNGSGIEERAYDDWGNLIITIDEKYFRPSEVDILLGDYSKAERELGWKPKVKFKELAKTMIISDLNYVVKNLI